MFRKIRTATTHYTPIEWGTKVEGEKIKAWAHFVRTDIGALYSFYGDDADVYREFEEAGFTKSAEVKDFKEADRWLKREVFGEEV